MALWGKSTSAASRPKFVVDNTDAQGSAGAREDVYATTAGWVQTSGKGHSGNDNSNATPEDYLLQFNTTIGHDIVVGPHSVVSSGVTLGGAVAIGALTFVGMGSSIRERVTVGTQSIVGFGSVVYKDIPDGMIVLGNPARVARRNEDKKVF